MAGSTAESFRLALGITAASFIISYAFMRNGADEGLRRAGAGDSTLSDAELAARHVERDRQRAVEAAAAGTDWIAQNDSNDISVPPTVAAARAARASAWLHDSGGSIVQIDAMGQEISVERPGPSTVLVDYVFMVDEGRSDQASLLCRENVDRFVRNAVADDERVHYLFTAVGDSPLPDSLARIVEAQKASGGAEYSNVLVRRDPPAGSDLCQWARTHVLLARDPDKVHEVAMRQSEWHDDADATERAPLLRSSYDHYAFVNCGAAGPFVKPHDDGSAPHPLEWLATFIGLLEPLGGQDTDDSAPAAVASSSINCGPTPHAQTHFAVMTKQAEVTARELWIRGACTSRDKNDAIAAEIGLSHGLLSRGRNIASTQPHFAGVDFRVGASDRTLSDGTKVPSKLEACAVQGSWNPWVCFPPEFWYGCRPVDPFESVFVKAGGELLRGGQHTPGLVECMRSIDAGATDCDYLHNAAA